MIVKNCFRLLLGVGCLTISLLSPAIARPEYQLQPPHQQKQPLTSEQLRKLAQSTIVRVISSENQFQRGGSGSLILRRGGRHYLLTSLHVVDHSGQYRIQTPDEKIYWAQVVATFSSPVRGDIALLRFNSLRSYPVLPVAVSLKGLVDETTFACGFPITDQLIQSERLYCNTGKMTVILKEPLVGGYQLGYTNSIKKGMSGGPVLNQYGALVGLNGLSQLPLFANAYTFQDGRLASEEEISILQELSWAIPTRAAIELFNQFRSQNPL